MNNQLYHRNFWYNYLGAVVLLIILNKEIQIFHYETIVSLENGGKGVNFSNAVIEWG